MNNKKDIYGTIVYNNKISYEGEWKNDMREGYGKILDREKNIIFQGYFKKDKKVK